MIIIYTNLTMYFVQCNRCRDSRNRLSDHRRLVRWFEICIFNVYMCIRSPRNSLQVFGYISAREIDLFACIKFERLLAWAKRRFFVDYIFYFFFTVYGNEEVRDVTEKRHIDVADSPADE